jgi:hypothetical protein
MMMMREQIKKASGKEEKGSKRTIILLENVQKKMLVKLKGY